MQYIAGEDLSEMLTQRSRPFSQEEVLRWADQLCDALDYLHTQDPEIIHRDIKPQNLKLTGRGQVVLLDFGLAKGSAGQMSVVTTSASIFGYTPNYAPLEQVQGLGTDARSDIYSLAATLYHLITNVKPPDALSRAGALVNGQPDPLLPANEVAAQINRAVANVLSKAMSQKRDDRFASAVLMREAFRLASVSGTKIREAEAIFASGTTAVSAADTMASDRSTRLMGEQTQAVGSEARTLLANDATKLRSAIVSGENEALVRPALPAGGSRKWLAAALLLLVVAGGAGGFYVYRARHNQAQKPTPVSETATQNNQPEVTTVPSTGNSEQTDASKNAELTNEKPKVERASQRVGVAKPSKEKNADTDLRPKPQTGNSETVLHDAETNADRNRDRNFGPPPGSLPRYDPEKNQQDFPRHPQRASQMPHVRTFPNGMRVVTQPDGTKIVTMPNGTTRIVPPGEKLNRKRNRLP